jgi:hypothetical protein
LKSIEAAAGMGINHAERRFLEAQRLQNLAQHQMFEDVGNIAGVEKVAIVH